MVIVNALRKDASAEIASLSGGEHFTFSSQKKVFDAGLLKISKSDSQLLSAQPQTAARNGFRARSARAG